MHLDILIFAAIAVFLILRLRSVLGTRTGDERQRPNPFVEQNTPAPQAMVAPPRAATSNIPFQPPADVDAETAEGLSEIAGADPAFTTGDFMSGAKAAFEMIVTAYNKGDRATLKPLVSPKLYADFDAVIADREKQGLIAETVIHRIASARIKSAKLGGAMAYITVSYDVEQTFFVRDAQSRVVAGNPDSRTTVSNIWTFSRDTRSADPNWTLIETATAEG